MPRLSCGLLLLIICCSCNNPPETALVSEKPPALDDAVRLSANPGISKIAVKSTVTTEQVSAIISEQIPLRHDDSGRDRICDKVLGIKVCGTVNWQYALTRDQNITVDTVGGRFHLSVPMNFTGTAGIEGSVARALSLSSLDFDGKVELDIGLGIDFDSDWCPAVDSTIEYQWIRKPRLRWTGGIEFSITEQLDKAIDEQLQHLPLAIAQSVDCDTFRERIASHWRGYSFPLETPFSGALYLNVVPTGFAFTSPYTANNDITLGFALEGTTTVESTVGKTQQFALPELRKATRNDELTTVEIVIRVPYKDITALTNEHISGNTYASETAAGTAAVTVLNADITGHSQGLALGLDINAELPGSSKKIPGLVYLIATPEFDQASQSIKFAAVRLTTVLENQLWNYIANTFEQFIIARLNTATLVDLSDELATLEQKFVTEISDPANTGGARLSAQEVDITITELQPEADSLAIRMRLVTSLKLQVNASVFSDTP